ncbi:hypothetical protein BDW59DRAFT_163116 [Aspergillus cavernicola]|uniref:Major facilitator superfamily domain-containing protein n=1 Tax=Aspergillus cavernicola TaxID=176166 RepID=A0ABR4I717_9EURO
MPRLKVSSGVIDIIEPAVAESLLAAWIHGTLDNQKSSEAVLYLILAYAAQAHASSLPDQRRAHSSYHHGRRIAVLHLTDDPSLDTVQAFLLIMLRKALGLHRRDGRGIEVFLSKMRDDGVYRERIWATLRYHDVFFCAMMSRTSSTITTRRQFAYPCSISRFHATALHSGGACEQASTHSSSISDVHILGYTSSTAQLLTVPMYITAAVVAVFGAWLSDRYKKRSPFILFFMSLLPIRFIIVLASSGRGVPGVVYLGVFVAVVGIYLAFPGNVTWISVNLAGDYKRAAGMAMHIGLGNLAGAMSSNFYREKDSPK